jgi:GAF domain-containing protein
VSEADAGLLGRRWTQQVVFETGRRARVDRHAGPSGEAAVAGGDVGFRSAVATPIIVEGRVWGAIWIGSLLAQQPLAADAEARLASSVATGA